MRQESTAVFWGETTQFSKCTFSGSESFLGSVDCDVCDTANGCGDLLHCRLGTDFGKQVPCMLHGQLVVLTGVAEVRNFQISTSALLRVEATSLS
jgi:hypothetical protein